MAVILRSSSPVALSGTLVSGPKSPQSDLLLTARVGNNGLGGDSEVFLQLPVGDPVAATVTWDPIFGSETLEPLLSVFQIRLVLDANPGLCQGAAGTIPWLEIQSEPFTQIVRVELTASVQNAASQREASWESAYVQFRYEGGYSEDVLLDALPRAHTPQKFRRASSDPPHVSSLSLIEQYADLSAPSVTGLTVVGLIRFRANEPPAPPEIVGANDLQVSVAVFTNASDQGQSYSTSQRLASPHLRPATPKRHRP